MSTAHPPHGQAEPNRRPPHVLIVEDEAATASLIRAIVLRHGHGCTATIVRDGLQAMRYLRRAPPFQDQAVNPKPDLVILDLGLPGVSGFQVLTWMDSTGHVADSPVVVFSGSSDPEAARRAYSLGARAYLPKSADPNRLVEVVRDTLARWAPASRDGTLG